MAKGIAARLAPYMAQVLTHPGDGDTPPFPLAPLPVFATQATMPKGMAEDMAEQAGLPHPDFARIYCEAWLALLESVGEVTLVPNDELSDLRAAAAAREHRRNQILTFTTPCGAQLRAMAKGFDTDKPEVPCDMVKHECRRR